MVLSFCILAVMHTLLVDVGVKGLVDVVLDLLFSVFFTWLVVPERTLTVVACALWRPWQLLWCSLCIVLHDLQSPSAPTNSSGNQARSKGSTGSPELLWATT